MNINPKNQLEKAKKSIKSITKKELSLGLAIGVPTAGCVIMGGILLEQDVVGRAIAKRLINGEVIERVLTDGSKLIVKLVKVGEEVCSCEHS